MCNVNVGLMNVVPALVIIITRLNSMIFISIIILAAFNDSIFLMS